jgi:hypothetical protein
VVRWFGKELPPFPLDLYPPDPKFVSISGVVTKGVPDRSGEHVSASLTWAMVDGRRPWGAVTRASGSASSTLSVSSSLSFLVIFGNGSFLI